MVRNNKEEMNQRFSEILSIHVACSIVIVFMYFGILLFLMDNNRDIFLFRVFIFWLLSLILIGFSLELKSLS